MKEITILIFILSILGCTSDNSPFKQLELLSSYTLNIPEPSGLTSDESGNILYTVSDNTNKIYKITTTGQLLQTFTTNGNDLEGICLFHPNKVLLADERLKNIIEYSLTNGETTTYHNTYENENTNSGIEGITYNPNTQTIYFLNEKNPDKLFQLNSNFVITATYDLNFANDYSGICYDANDNLLWIVSDESQSVNKCTLEGRLLEKYIINVQKPEGITLINTKIYIISDSQEKLFIFQKPN